MTSSPRAALRSLTRWLIVSGLTTTFGHTASINLRTVTTDGVSQRKAIDRVYAQIASGSAAQTFISEFYRGDPPFKRAETETVSVEVKSVLPTSDRTYEVEWLETTRDLYGTVKATDRWKGYFAIALNPPKDERQARINPLGVYITNASWAKVL